MGSRQKAWRSILKSTTSAAMSSPPAPPMASTASSGPIVEGVFAIHKPTSISSAQVIRECQKHFTPSTLFSPWLDRESSRRNNESHNQKQKRRNKRENIQVKMGHGGTLDPLATGVLILGVGAGTKVLGRFLECTKSYEAILVFGAATDTYDSEGKIVARQPFEHITKEQVEAEMEKFKGKIMQKPPIYSAISVQGKRLYEYAREGKVPPVEIKERPVEVLELEMLEWMEGGEHEWRWPEREAEKQEMDVVGKVLGLKGTAQGAKESNKREREDVAEGAPSPKKAKAESQSAKDAEASAPQTTAAEAGIESESTKEQSSTTEKAPEPSTTEEQQPIAESNPPKETRPRCLAPAVRIRMTVTSGFYVRSLCHDLGMAVGSVAHMTNLIRTRQGDFDLAAGNVLEYDELEGGEEKWGPRVKEMLESWQSKEGNNPPQNNNRNQNGGGGQGRNNNKNRGNRRQQDRAPRRNSSSAEE